MENAFPAVLEFFEVIVNPFRKHPQELYVGTPAAVFVGTMQFSQIWVVEGTGEPTKRAVRGAEKFDFSTSGGGAL
jgi:hypothetical protein